MIKLYSKQTILQAMFFSIIAVSISTADTTSIHQHDKSHDISTVKVLGDPYYLTTCPVTGQKLGSMGKPILHSYEGREIRLCCAGCTEKFDQEPKKYLKKIDQTMIEDQLPHYPMDICLVTNQKLTAMGEPINHIYRNRLVRFCCNNCVTQFEKDPEKYLKQLDASVIKKQKEHYPAVCIASGHELGGSMGEAKDIVIANRLIRLCCDSCLNMVHENPNEFLSKLENESGEHSGHTNKKEHKPSDHSGHKHTH